MSRTVCITICRTLTLEENSIENELTDEELKQEVLEDYDDWYWDDEGVTVEVLPTKNIILGDE